MKLFKTNFKVVSFHHHPAKALNGLTSNDLFAPRNAFLNLHGRIIAVFDQIQISDDELWIVLIENSVDALARHLDRYLKLSGVSMQIKNSFVYFDLSKDAPISDGDVCLSQKSGRLIVSHHEYISNVSDEEFALFRLKNHLPLHGIDFTDEMILNVSEEYVSFTKGCYLGQEFVAKVHHRSKPTWKLVMKTQDECSNEDKNKMTSKAFDSELGKILGFVFVKND